MNKGNKILLVEDEKHLAKGLSYNLKKEGLFEMTQKKKVM